MHGRVTAFYNLFCLSGQRPYRQTLSGTVKGSLLEVLEILLILLSQLIGIRLPLPVILGIHVEARSISGISHRRENRSFPAAVEDIVPIRLLEKGMRFYAGCAAANVSQPARAIDGAQLADDVFCVISDWGI